MEMQQSYRARVNDLGNADASGIAARSYGTFLGSRAAATAASQLGGGDNQAAQIAKNTDNLNQLPQIMSILRGVEQYLQGIGFNFS